MFLLLWDSDHWVWQDSDVSSRNMKVAEYFYKLATVPTPTCFLLKKQFTCSPVWLTSIECYIPLITTYYLLKKWRPEMAIRTTEIIFGRCLWSLQRPGSRMPGDKDNSSNHKTCQNRFQLELVSMGQNDLEFHQTFTVYSRDLEV